MSAVTIRGALIDDAECRTSTDGAAWLFVQVSQGPASVPAHAAQRLGTGPAAQIAARSAARHLRRGLLITVRARACDIALSPRPHLVLTGVDSIQYFVPLPRHEPQPNDEAA